METLHIYAQESWHDEAYITGTHDALHALRDAIDRALSHNTPTFAESFCCDGEGYRITLALNRAKRRLRATCYTTHERTHERKSSDRKC